MLDAIQLYFSYWGVSVRAQMQYRASFLMMAFGTFIMTAAEFATIWILFERFETLKGWRFAEVALFYGMMHTAFAIAEATARGFDMFGDLVKRGDFDGVLLKPRNTAFQIAARDLDLKRVGRFAVAVTIVFWAASALDVHWTLARVSLMFITVASGVSLFYGLLIIQATMAFWTTESLEMMNTVTYGGVEAGSYPLTIYNRWFRRFFTGVVPLACVSYYPMLAILERTDVGGMPQAFLWLSPLVGFAFLLVSLRVWDFGVRHYRSTGS